MIIGVGIDQIEVRRISRKLEDELFMDRIFSSREQAYCRARGRQAQHYAARFAAKEAFLKALGIGLSESLELNAIEVLPDSNGKPNMELSGHFAEKFQLIGAKEIHVSMSHLEDIASAIVIIEK